MVNYSTGMYVVAWLKTAGISKLIRLGSSVMRCQTVTGICNKIRLIHDTDET